MIKLLKKAIIAYDKTNKVKALGFDGIVITIMHRLNDVEDKWVVAPRNYKVSDDEIIDKTKFQEQYFETELIAN